MLHACPLVERLDILLSSVAFPTVITRCKCVSIVIKRIILKNSSQIYKYTQLQKSQWGKIFFKRSRPTKEEGRHDRSGWSIRPLRVLFGLSAPSVLCHRLRHCPQVGAGNLPALSSGSNRIKNHSSLERKHHLQSL